MNQVAGTGRKRQYGGGRGLRALAAVAAALVALAGAAACGGGSGGSAAPGGSAASGSASGSGGGLATVTFAEPVTNLTASASVIAQQEGFFTKHHLKVNIVHLAGGSLVMDALASGSIDLGATSTTVILAAVKQKTQLIAVGAEAHGFGDLLVVSNAAWQQRHLSYTTSVDTMVNDIKGLTIGNMAPGDTGTYVLNGLVSSSGQDAASWFTHNSVRVASQQLVALQHGEIDATFTNVPVPEQAVEGGYGKILFEVNSVPEIANVLYGVTVARSSWAAAHPTEVKEFNAAMGEAGAFINEHPDQAAPLLKSLAAGQSVPAIQSELKILNDTSSAAFPAGTWENVAKVVNQFHLEPFTVTPDLYNAAYSDKYTG